MASGTTPTRAGTVLVSYPPSTQGQRCFQASFASPGTDHMLTHLISTCPSRRYAAQTPGVGFALAGKLAAASGPGRTCRRLQPCRKVLAQCRKNPSPANDDSQLVESTTEIDSKYWAPSHTSRRLKPRGRQRRRWGMWEASCALHTALHGLAWPHTAQLKCWGPL